MTSKGAAHLPKLGQSASAGALTSQAAVNPTGSLAKAASSTDLKKNGAAAASRSGSKAPPAPPPAPEVVLKFSTGFIGLSTQGTTVKGAALQAWMKGVRPGWIVKTVSGMWVRDDLEAEELLRIAAGGSHKYEIGFDKGRSKFGNWAELAAREEAERDRLRFKARRTFLYQGQIDRAEHRGITLAQLERVLSYAVENCSTWPDSQSKNSTAPLLDAQGLNLHNLNYWVILPTTKPKNCSFVELLTDQRQVPAYFVSHCWDEPVLDFLACIRLHSSTRQLELCSPYWICAYALRQAETEGELANGPTNAGFFKALQAARFNVVLVLDQQAAGLRRSWCLFELTMCLDRASTPIDILVYQQKHQQARILTHGLTKADEDLESKEVGKGLRAKLARDVDFPVDIALKGLAVDVESSEATEEFDRFQFLNWIVGREQRIEPLEDHPRYEELNKRLGGLLAGVLLNRASLSERGQGRRTRERCQKVSQALRLDTWRKSMDAHLPGLSVEGMEALIQGLPTGLEELKIRARSAQISNDDLNALAELLLSSPDPLIMKTLCLDVRSCNKVTDAGSSDFKEKLDAVAVAVDLKLDATEALQFIHEFTRPPRDMSVAFGMNLCDKPDTLEKWRLRKVPTVPMLIKALVTDEKSYARFAAARALGSLKDRALQAVPALEKAGEDDPTELVQHAAKSALVKVSGLSESQRKAAKSAASNSKSKIPAEPVAESVAADSAAAN